MTKNDDKRIPALRFKGFNDDWAQRMLGKIAVIIMGQSPDGSTYSKVPSTYILVQGNADIKNGWVKPRLWSSQSTKEAQKGDIILTVRAPVGEVAKTNYDVVLGRGVAGIRGNDFIFHLLTLMNINNYWNKFSTGSTFESINSNDIKKAIVNIPPQLEQGKIGKLLNTLNNLIALQQRKLQQLKLLKKAMLQDLFTDKNVPKLRFNGFDANWIQCKLEKEALLTMGQSPSGSTYSDQPSTYILVQGNADLKNGWVKPRIWTTQITKLAKKGDIIITVRAPAGKVGRTNFDVVLGRGVASIQGNDFIFYLLSKMDMNKYWKKYAAGSTFESINSNDIKNTRVHVPNLPEQNRIANLFLRLDDLIRFQQNKLNNLQKTKQFLLQNMFI